MFLFQSTNLAQVTKRIIMTSNSLNALVKQKSQQAMQSISVVFFPLLF